MCPKNGTVQKNELVHIWILTKKKQRKENTYTKLTRDIYNKRDEKMHAVRKKIESKEKGGRKPLEGKPTRASYLVKMPLLRCL
jgi:hypothetical protein